MRTQGLFRAMALSFLVTGCHQPQSSAPQVSDSAKDYQLSEEPSGSVGVKQLRETAADGDEIVVEGRIGGDSNPWVSGQAAFLVVDNSLKPCNEQEDDACETPWDYCCDLDSLNSSKALVKVVDPNGKTIRADARAWLGLTELQTVVVRGKAKRDDAGNLTILADGVFVRK